MHRTVGVDGGGTREGSRIGDAVGSGTAAGDAAKKNAAAEHEGDEDERRDVRSGRGRRRESIAKVPTTEARSGNTQFGQKRK
ncbi:hypothetical protein GCM10028856_21200 [Halopiger thermotolerans]